MSTVRLIVGCGALFALAGLSNQLAAEPSPKEKSGEIGAGLPEQAVARLGTVRFRHGAPITALALSNDGKYIASSSGDRTLRIWEAETGKPLRTIRCESRYVTGIAFSPDGKRVAADLESENVSIFEWQTTKPPRQIKTIVPHAVVWSPDGKWIGCAVADEDTALIFNALDSKQFHKIKGGERIAFSPDGKTFAVANIGGVIALYNLDDGKKFGELPATEKSTVVGLRYSKNGSTLLASHDIGIVVAWDLKKNARLHSFVAGGPAVFVPGDKSVAAIVDGRLALFDLQSGEKMLTDIETGRSSPFVFAGDANRVFVGGPYSRIAVWNRTTGKEELTGEGHAAEITGLAFGQQGDTLLSAGYDGIRIWSVKEKKELAGGRRSTIAQALAIAPNGRRFATAGPSSIHIWNPVDLTAAKPFPADPPYKLATKAEKIPFIAYTPDGERIAYAGADKTLNFADPGRGIDFAALNLSSDALAAAFGPNSRNLAVITRDGLLSYWSTGARGPNILEPKDQELWKKRVQRSPRAAVAISPNGLLIAASSVGRVLLLESATGRLWQGFDRQLGDGDVYTVAFSPDGRLLAVGHGGPEGIVRVWEVLTGKEIVAFRGHLGGVNAVAFSPTPNGQRIASAGADTSILLWDLTLPAGPEAKSLALNEAWNLLDSDDTKMAYQAVGTMITAGDKAIAMIDTGLKNAIENQTRIRKLIAQLNDDDFRVRRSARADLDKEGLRAWPALHEALRRKIPGETERLIKLIIEGMEARGLHAPDSGLFGESLRTVRAINVLERVGGKDAVGVIEKLADGKDDSRIAQEAKAALERLKK